MRHILPYPLWIGHIGDAHRPEQLASSGIRALIDLADGEKPNLLFRDIVCCRFPLVDGAGNPDWLLNLAIDAVASLVTAKIPTLVYCGAGMSRSPSIAAAAISRHEGKPLQFGLDRVKTLGSLDISPSLWGDLDSLVAKTGS